MGWIWMMDDMDDGEQIITTSAEVTLHGGLVREYPKNGLKSGSGIILTNLPRW